MNWQVFYAVLKAWRASPRLKCWCAPRDWDRMGNLMSRRIGMPRLERSLVCLRRFNPLRSGAPTISREHSKARPKGFERSHPADSVFTANRNRILDFAAKNRLPTIYPWREYVVDGGLMSYAPSLSDLYRRA